MYTIVVDAMGGDHGSSPNVQGTILALKKSKKKFNVILVGDPSTFTHKIPKKLAKYIEIVETHDVFGMDESATEVRKRKESSIYKAIELVKSGRADALVSAGHSGATMALATLQIGRVKGVQRPAIATLMPTETGGKTLVLDVGANTDCKPEHLFQFAILGEAYAKDVLKVESPRVGLLSNGEEEKKSPKVTKSPKRLLKCYSRCLRLLEMSKVTIYSTTVLMLLFVTDLSEIFCSKRVKVLQVLFPN